MDAGTRRRAAEALRAIKRGEAGWFSLSEAVMGRPAPRDEVVARLADLIDTGEDTTVDAYDLLPVEDREALRWVHGHGGLEVLSRMFQDADNRRVELCGALGVDDDMGWSDAMAEMVKRLMPDGMEWPMWDDGRPVTYDDAPGDVIGMYLALDGSGYALMTDLPYQLMSEPGERVERPAPKVLDADGAEIRVGDTLYYVDGREQKVNTVARLTNGFVQFGRINEAGYVTYCEGACISPGQLTHRAPVLAADGEPLREGEHVYHVETGTELVVKELPKPGDYQAVVVFALPTSPASHLTSFDPDQLTHERPESKCRDCAHWQKDPTADNMGVCWFFYHEYEGEDCYAARRADIGACEEFMPRAKALAGVS